MNFCHPPCHVFSKYSKNNLEFKTYLLSNVWIFVQYLFMRKRIITLIKIVMTCS